MNKGESRQYVREVIFPHVSSFPFIDAKWESKQRSGLYFVTGIITTYTLVRTSTIGMDKSEPFFNSKNKLQYKFTHIGIGLCGN
jgi:hypothetical protein